MSNYFLHERLQRTPELMARLASTPVAVCGGGALGANLLENLARTGFGRLKVIDRDRVEEHNLSTQPYFKGDVGSFKARILAHNLYRALGVKVEALCESLTCSNVGRMLEGAALVVDCFDNHASRAALTEHCRAAAVECLHAGMATGYSEVIWNSLYRVPADTGADDCNYPLARNLVLLTVSVAAEVLIAYLADGGQRNYTVTLKDLAVRPYTG